jgi:HEAT repeat protein
LIDSRGLLPGEPGEPCPDVELVNVFVEPWVNGTISHSRRSEAAMEELAYETITKARRDPATVRKELANQQVALDELRVVAASGQRELPHLTELLHLLGEEPAEGIELAGRKGTKWRRKVKLSQAVIDHERLVLIGGPATGKTTALRWISWRLAAIGGPGGDADTCVSGFRNLIPLYAPLRELNREPGEPRPDVETWLLDRMTPTGTAEEIALTEEAIRTGRVIVLLDGLDEVIGAKSRAEVAQEIFTLFHEWPQCRVILTSRPEGYRAVEVDNGWCHYTLLDLDQRQAGELLRSWLEVMAAAAPQGDPPDVEEESRQLLAQLSATRSMARLMGNPLLLAILVTSREHGVRVPERLTKILHSAVIAMAFGLEPARDDGSELTEVNRLVQALAYVGYRFHASHWDSMATLPELRTLLVEGLIQTGLGASAARRRANLVCTGVERRPSLLIEQAPGKYGFFQLTFQEYLAGYYLARHADSDLRSRLVREQLHTQRWYQVIGFAIAAAEPAAASKMLQEVAEHRSRWEQHLGRDAVAAVRYLADFPGINPEVREELVLDVAWHCPELGVDSLRFEAGHVLGQLPPEATSSSRVRKAIVQLVEEHQGDWRALLIRALDPEEHRELLLRRLPSRPERVRAAAVQALAPAVRHDAKVRQALLRALNDGGPEVRQAAVTGLAILVSEDELSRTAILECLADKHKDVRAAAVRALAVLAPADDAIRAALLDRIGDRVNRVRAAAVAALTGLVSSNEYVKTALFERLEDWDEHVCAAAVEALAPLAEQDENLRAAVLASLRTNRWSARAAAVAALAPLVERDQTIRDTLLVRLKADLWGFRPSAVKVLTALAPTLIPEIDSIRDALADTPAGDRKQPARPELGSDRDSLLAHLEDRDEQVRQAAVTALAGLVPDDQKLRSELISRISCDTWRVREAAVAALAPLVTSNQEVRTALLAMHDDEHRQVIGAAVTALAACVPEDQEVRSCLGDWLDDPSPKIRIATLTAMAPVMPDDEQIRAALLARFDDDNGVVRAAAIEALAPVLQDDDKLKAKLRKCLDDEDETVRAVAVREAASLFPADEQLESALRDRLGDPSHDVAVAAVATLAPTAAHNEQVRALLIERMTSDSRAVGAAAVGALAALAPRDEEIRKALVDCLTDQSWDVRAAAVRALAPLAPAIGEIRKALFDRLAGERHSVVHSIAVAAMAPLVTSDQSIRGALLNHFAYHYDHDVRAAAVRALAPLAAVDENVRSALLNRLADREPVVRAAAALALATAPEEVQSALIGRLHDVTRLVRTAAAKALGLGCGREGWPTAPVESLAWSSEVFPWVRRAALEALVVASRLLPAK